MSEILGFNGPFRFMSNFMPCRILFDGVIYASVEHAYVASKTLDHEIRSLIEKAVSPAYAKRLGRTIELRPDWEYVKLGLMRNFLRQKFVKEPYRNLLLLTEDAYLEETNWWKDQYWGVCDGVGLNHLGRLLMEIRDEMRDTSDD